MGQKNMLRKATVLLLFTAASVAAAMQSDVSASQKPEPSEKNMILKKGAKKQIKIKKRMSFKKLKFKSMDKKIASVNKKGIVKGKNPGKTKIKITGIQNGINCHSFIKITVKESNHVKDDQKNISSAGTDASPGFAAVPEKASASDEEQSAGVNTLPSPALSYVSSEVSQQSAEVNASQSPVPPDTTAEASPAASAQTSETAVPVSSSLPSETLKSSDFLLDVNSERGYSEFSPAYKAADEVNPIITNSYTADPGVMVYDGRLYVYLTNDSQQYEAGNRKENNTYGYIQSIHIISTDDMINWTDHGLLQVAAGNRKDKFGVAANAGCSWAPCAVHKKINGEDKFFIYFTNGGYQIGVLEGESPTGPFKDPIGKCLLGPNTDNPTTTGALDPSVFTDDDGTSYLCYGSGTLNNGKNGARIRKLADDMISFDGPEVTIDAPYFFEDSGINKINGKYYFSYCSDWNSRSSEYSSLGLCSIAYMTSDHPEGPYTYQGDILVNCGNVFGTFGNNHHSITEFNGEYYMFYHTMVLQDKMGCSLGYRSVHVNRLTMDPDGTLEPVKQDLKGVAQIRSFNPYNETAGTVFADCSGMLSTHYLTDGARMEAVSDPEHYRYSWSVIRGADFGDTGATSFKASFKMNAGSDADIKIFLDSPGGNPVAEAHINGTEDNVAEINVPCEKITGKHDIYFTFDGSVYEFINWKFSE